MPILKAVLLVPVGGHERAPCGPHVKLAVDVCMSNTNGAYGVLYVLRQVSWDAVLCCARGGPSGDWIHCLGLCHCLWLLLLLKASCCILVHKLSHFPWGSHNSR